ncbi:MAG: hypothetical protein VKK59_06715 [Vampirovibrionales bacterium]|nr:hypothetical protein [Vampirovibrionales bacterium]
MTRSWWQQYGILLALVFLALAIRLWGLDFGLPNLSRVDEQNISEYSLLRLLGSCWRGACDLNPHFFEYPSLFIYMTAGAYAAFYTVGQYLGLFQSPADILGLYGNDQTSFHVITRFFGAVMGGLTVIPVALIAQRMAMGNRWVGWLAAALLGFCYLHVRDSHFGVTDVPSTLFLAWTLERASAMAFASSQGAFQRALRWASVFSGLAAGMKYPAGLALFVPLMLVFCRFGRCQPKTALKLAFISTGIAAGTFIISTPFAMLDTHQFFKDLAYQMDHMAGGHLMNLGKGWLYHARFSLWFGLQPVGFIVSVLSMAGYALWCACASDSRKKPVWALHFAFLTFFVACYGFIGNTLTVFMRYIIVLLPIFVVYSALGVWQLWQWMQKYTINLRLAQAVMALLILATVGPSLWMSLKCSALLATPDTRVLARQWLLKHLQPNEAVGIGMGLAHLSLPNTVDKYFLTPLQQEQVGHATNGRGFAPSPLPPMVGKIINNNREYNLSSYRDPAMMRQLGIRYFALAVSPLTLFSTPSFELVPIEAIYPRVATFSPMVNGYFQPPESAFNAIDAFYMPFSTLDHVERPGPEIRIYKVP